tara:strand:+ start:2192 stop:3343 length:1152 start_codon:yes stop_codon:yes gene_type:complete
MNKKFNDIISCRALYFNLSFYIGLWTIRIPTIKDQLDTDYIGIGYIMATFAFGSILIMIFSNEIIKKFSSKISIGVSGIAQAILWPIAPLIFDLNIFLFYAFIFGLCYGLFEVAINLQASNIEKREKKSMMSGFHAFFSLGLLAGSFCTSLLLEINVSFFSNVLIYVIILLPLHIYFVSFLNKDHISIKEGKGNIFFFWPAIILVLVFITISDSFTEGGIDSWAALYMRDSINVEGFKIGIATICFNFFMVIGRLTGDRIRDKIGVYKFLICLLILTIIGLLIILIFNSVFSSIIGFSIVGFGISSIIPLAYSLASRIEGVDSAVGISIISISAYGVFMIAPAFMGYIAKYLGINFVFSPMILLFLFSLIIVIIYKKKLSYNF